MKAHDAHSQAPYTFRLLKEKILSASNIFVKRPLVYIEINSVRVQRKNFFILALGKLKGPNRGSSVIDWCDQLA